nr:MAG TPA: DNA repair protein REV1 [Bacteriophage sp.]DAQ02452.1 MAG TPA: DNA repair protein REV1 [Caudoviricetes sp.]
MVISSYICNSQGKQQARSTEDFLSSVASCLLFLKYPEKVFKKRRTFF